MNFKTVALSLIMGVVVLACDQDNNRNPNRTEIVADEGISKTDIEAFVGKNLFFKRHEKKLVQFYKLRHQALAWSYKDKFRPQSKMFLKHLNDARRRGNIALYDPFLFQRFNEIERYSTNKENRLQLKEADLWLTAAFFEYEDEIWGKKLIAKKAGIDLQLKSENLAKDLSLIQQLELVLYDGEVVSQVNTAEYDNLQKALDLYLGIRNNGGWPEVKVDKSLKRGDRDKAVVDLKKRLAATGEYKEGEFDEEFSRELEDAVKLFQRKHGIKESGRLYKETKKQLNVSVDDRISQIKANMERWRWLMNDVPADRIWVNVPEFRMYVFENDSLVMNMDVIVGNERNATPSFNSKIEYVVLSPTWHIPKDIIKEEIITVIKKDPSFIVRHKLEILSDGTLLVADSLDWNTLSDEEIDKITINQYAVPTNPLGKVKFLFPNEHDIYIHDTPQGRLFSENKRDFSHGCIRIAEPLKFAQYLLKNDYYWSEEKITEAMNLGVEQYIPVKPLRDVYIVYFTAWIDKSGEVNFRDDIYDQDSEFASAEF